MPPHGHVINANDQDLRFDKHDLKRNSDIVQKYSYKKDRGIN